MRYLRYHVEFGRFYGEFGVFCSAWRFGVCARQSIEIVEWNGHASEYLVLCMGGITGMGGARLGTVLSFAVVQYSGSNRYP